MRFAGQLIDPRFLPTQSSSHDVSFVAPERRNEAFEKQERIHQMGHWSDSARWRFNPETGEYEPPVDVGPLY